MISGLDKLHYDWGNLKQNGQLCYKINGPCLNVKNVKKMFFKTLKRFKVQLTFVLFLYQTFYHTILSTSAKTFLFLVKTLPFSGRALKEAGNSRE